MENNSSTVKWIAIAIIVASIIISGAILYTNPNSGGTANNNNNGDQVAVDISKVNITGAPFVGNESAPVVVAFWSDYQCPFCKKTVQEALALMMPEYVNTGKVKIVYKDFAFLGDDSTTAALAARAVWEVAPTKFGQWHEAMFVKQDEEHGGWGTKADILALTKSLGIDSVKVGQLMTSKAVAYQQAIDADKAEAGTFGITGTPSTIIGKQLIVGAQSYATFKSAIDGELNK